jgi:hypothetical protein
VDRRVSEIQGLNKRSFAREAFLTQVGLAAASVFRLKGAIAQSINQPNSQPTNIAIGQWDNRLILQPAKRPTVHFLGGGQSMGGLFVHILKITIPECGTLLLDFIQSLKVTTLSLKQIYGKFVTIVRLSELVVCELLTIIAYNPRFFYK